MFDYSNKKWLSCLGGRLMLRYWSQSFNACPQVGAMGEQYWRQLSNLPIVLCPSSDFQKHKPLTRPLLLTSASSIFPSTTQTAYHGWTSALAAVFHLLIPNFPVYPRSQVSFLKLQEYHNTSLIKTVWCSSFQTLSVDLQKPNTLFPSWISSDILVR